MAFLNEEGLKKFYDLIDGKKADKGEIVKTATGVSVNTISGLSATNVQEALEALKTAIGTGGTNSAVTVAKSTNSSTGATTYTISQGGTNVANGAISVPSLAGYAKSTDIANTYVSKQTFDTLLNTNASSTAIDTFNEIVAFLAGIDNSDSEKTLKTMIDAASAGLSVSSYEAGVLGTSGKYGSDDVVVQNDPNTLTVSRSGNTFTLSGRQMVGATSSTAGVRGMVPSPAAGDQAKVLTGAGTWADPTASIAAIDVDAWAKANGLT